MIKNLFKKIKNKIQEKTGASMAIVITTMSLLIIMGTSFSGIAYNAYKHSYGTICRQQAMYTAKSILDGFVDEFISNSDLRGKVGDALFAQVNDPANADKPITEVNAEINIAGLHDYMVDQQAVAGGANTSDCKMYVSYSDETRSKLKLMVSAKYKGFENALSVVLAYTNKASVELSKIMSNTLFFTSPIVDLMYYVDQNKTKPFKDFAINGDVYIDKPMWKEGEENPYEHISAVPNVENADWLAVNGHTLNITNEGRPNYLYDERGIPIPELDAEGNKQYIYKDGKLVEMRDMQGNIIYESGGRDVFVLNDPMTNFSTTTSYEIDKDGHVIPERDLKKNSSNLVLNGENKNGLKYIEKHLVDYIQNNNPGSQFNGKTDKIGNPILSTFINVKEEKERYVVDNKPNGDGYDVFKAEQIYGEKEKRFVRWGKGEKWCWIEVYKTIDPITKEPILVTGREGGRNIYDGGEWRITERSFKRVKQEDTEWGVVNGTCYRMAPYNDKGKFISWDEAQSQPCYNVYQYQHTRQIRQIGGTVPMYQYKVKTGPNDWTEVYLRSHYWGSIELTNPMPVVIDGNLKCNTDVLLGLNNRSFESKKETGHINGEAHGFRDPVTNAIVPVSFDSDKDDYTIPMHNVLSLTGDVFVNGDAKGENLWVGGSLYAKDNNPEDDNFVDVFGWKPGCKGNVFLEQARYTKDLFIVKTYLGAYMEIKKDIIADGYVFMGGVFADFVDKVVVGGDIHAGKYNADGTRWGNVGVGDEIPVEKFYMEDQSIPVIDDDIKANGGAATFPAGIYGYRTNTEETRFGKKNRYRLGSGDVVLQQTHVKGSIYATGDVYLSNGTWVDGDIYTPGNVYVTKGDAGITHSIEYDRDARCRVFGNIYAGGDVVVTGGCEIGDYQAAAGQKGYKSNIYCGGNFYSSGRVEGFPVIGSRDCDVLSGSLYCAGNATIYGKNSKTLNNYSRVGYNGGDIRVGGDLICDEFVAISNHNASVYVGGDVDFGNYCAFDNHGPTIIEGDCKVNGGYIHTEQLFVGGDFSVGGKTRIYKHGNPTTYFIMGNIKKLDGGLRTDLVTDDDYSKPFRYYVNGSNSGFTYRFNKDNYLGLITNSLQVNIYGKTITILNDKNKFSDELKPEGWELLDNDEYSIKIHDATLNDLTYFKYMAYKNFEEAYAPLEKKLTDYQHTVDAKIREWTPPDSTNRVYNAEYNGKGINGSAESKFRDPSNPDHFIIDDSIFDMPSLTLNNNQRLTIDTSSKNIHIVLKSDLILGAGARVDIRGKNMAFIYFKEEGPPKKIDLGANSSFGAVVGIDPNDTANHAGLHIVATQKDFKMVVNKDAVINSYNYMPRGILDFNLARPQDHGVFQAIVANPAGSYVINRIQGMDLPTMDYWRIKFTNTKSPLILDMNGDINYGDNNQEITDFKGVEWVVVNYM